MQNRLANEMNATNGTDTRYPRGFTRQSGGLASEYAREQGWEMNAEGRAQIALGKQDEDGGRDYEYGAADFGDEAKDTSGATLDDETKPPAVSKQPMLVEAKAGLGKPPVVIVKAERNAAANSASRGPAIGAGTRSATKRVKKTA